MKNLLTIAYLFAICILITGCNRNSDDSGLGLGEMGEANTSFLFDFENLEIGQTFQFTLLSGEKYWDNDEKDIFSYTGDTLEIELMDQFDNTYVFEERILPGSAMFSTEESDYWMGRDSVYTHQWVVENDSLKIEPNDSDWFRGHLFFGGNFWEGGVFIPLQDFTTAETSIEGWKTSEDYCECDMDMYIEDYNLGGIQYDRLNVAVRNAPMQTDGNGSTYVYNNKDGIVRSINYSWWTGIGFGWDRIK